MISGITVEHVSERQVSGLELTARKAAMPDITAILGLINQETGILPEREFEQRVKKEI